MKTENYMKRKIKTYTKKNEKLAYESISVSSFLCL